MPRKLRKGDPFFFFFFACFLVFPSSAFLISNFFPQEIFDELSSIAAHCAIWKAKAQILEAAQQFSPLDTPFSG